ncbi:MAG: hypothetical protein ABGX89_18025, partial [Pseudomonas sp.]
KGQKRINIVHKNAGLWMCLFALTSSLKSAFLFLSFPGFREEPFFSCKRQASSCKQNPCGAPSRGFIQTEIAARRYGHSQDAAAHPVLLAA